MLYEETETNKNTFTLKFRYIIPKSNLEVFFLLVQEFSYQVEVKEEAIRLRLAGVPVSEVMESIGIKSET